MLESSEVIETDKAGGLLAARYGARTAMNMAALGIPLATIWFSSSNLRRLTRFDDVDPTHTPPATDLDRTI